MPWVFVYEISEELKVFPQCPIHKVLLQGTAHIPSLKCKWSLSQRPGVHSVVPRCVSSCVLAGLWGTKKLSHTADMRRASPHCAFAHASLRRRANGKLSGTACMCRLSPCYVSSGVHEGRLDAWRLFHRVDIQKASPPCVFSHVPGGTWSSCRLCCILCIRRALLHCASSCAF